ncbi:phosphoribosylformylglycinamidine synthase subunit PurS [Geminicoccus roseus]|uniref:phosphoribosylformylglycinamidine synthase subunit PurS n=1 Tax=Geminicoccus roseus TaxID=404900 RepID=UPI00041E3666|nr:phosphoribosylformylglycinamidine synthase subunit PurS [Geminicoccus roseus]
MKVSVEVGLKQGVLDPEAVTIERSLLHLGFEGVSGMRKTRVFKFDLAVSDRGAAEAAVKAMCEKLLANPVIENYRYRLEE